MLLYFTSIDIHANFRECSWWFNTVEAAFDALNAVSAKGNHLINAELIDDQHRVTLPIEAFDGYYVTTHIEALENDWQKVLSQPIDVESAYAAYWINQTKNN